MSLIHYDINFRNKQLDEVHVRITDYENYDPFDANPDTFIDLIGIAPAFELETFNTNEDKLSSILGQRATIRFKSTNAVNFSTFAEGEDYRFFVRATYASGTKFILTGWLLMDENQQGYLPPGQPVTLYATDNLGSLKDIELSDFDGARPVGKYRLIEIIAWCLNKTESVIDFIDGIKVASNLFENNMDNTDNCPLNQTYVDVLTFEKSRNEYEDCFTVLEKILFSLGARVCYYNNFWYILRIDEYKGSAFYLASYSPGGVYQSRILGQSLDKTLDDDIDFVNADTVQRVQRPYKRARVNIKYAFPDEIPANNNFLTGTFSSSVAGPPSYDLYIPNNWTYVIIVGGGTEGSHSNEYFIKVTFDVYGAEVERFLFLPATTGNVEMRVKSDPVYVCVGDKFNLDVDFRYSTDLGGGSGHFTISQVQIRLFGDDGSFWTMFGHSGSNLTDESVYWEVTNSVFLTNSHFLSYEGSSQNVDFTQWQSLSVKSAAIPVTGYIVIHLMNNQTSGSQSKDFYNLKFEYLPLINGTNKREFIQRPTRPFVRIKTTSTGERFSMSSTDNYNKKFEEDFFLFDAPCKMFKGAMFYLDTGVYYLTTNWFDQAMGVYDIPGLLDQSYRFLHWQSYYVWNQLRTPTRILNASLFGLDTASGGYAGLIHKYGVANALAPLSGQSFIILSMRQDWHTCEWSATFAQVHDSAQARIGGSAGENFEFKYLE